jgi:hypothetical protein
MLRTPDSQDSNTRRSGRDTKVRVASGFIWIVMLIIVNIVFDELDVFVLLLMLVLLLMSVLLMLVVALA